MPDKGVGSSTSSIMETSGVVVAEARRAPCLHVESCFAEDFSSLQDIEGGLASKGGFLLAWFPTAEVAVGCWLLH